MNKPKILIFSENTDLLESLYLSSVKHGILSEACNTLHEVLPRIKRFLPDTFLIDEETYSGNMSLPDIGKVIKALYKTRIVLLVKKEMTAVISEDDFIDDVVFLSKDVIPGLIKR